MGEFLGRLTRGDIYNEKDETRTHLLYWTHTVKCFLQNEKYPGIGLAKRKMGHEFRQAVKACANYLSQELEPIHPKLVVAVGKEAAMALEHLKYGQLVWVYHPAWRFGSRARKQERLLELYHRVKAIEGEHLIDILPALDRRSSSVPSDTIRIPE
jgi:uracil-DNA glycosylase